jgi:uncharacterized protein (DUF1778 family)
MTLSDEYVKEDARRTVMTTSPLRSEKLDIRLTPQAKRRLAAAAESVQRSVSDFVLTSALERADEALADRHAIALDAADWMKFLAALDAPPRPMPRMKKLLNEPGIFDLQ